MSRSQEDWDRQVATLKKVRTLLHSATAVLDEYEQHHSDGDYEDSAIRHVEEQIVDAEFSINALIGMNSVGE